MSSSRDDRTLDDPVDRRLVLGTPGPPARAGLDGVTAVLAVVRRAGAVRESAA